MKHFKLFFAAVLAVCMTACDGCNGGDSKSDSYIKVGKETFKNRLEAETNPQIIDYRADSLYKQGHIKGAINLPASISNATQWKDENSPILTTIQNTFSTNQKVYLYGNGGWGAADITLPGVVGRIWGKENTIHLESKFSDFQTNYPAWIVSEE